MAEKKKILLVNMAGLGDMVMMTPAARAIRQAYPDAFIETLCLDRGREVAERIREIDKVSAVTIGGRVPFPAWMLSLVKILMELRRRRFDVLLNFSLVSSSAGLLKVRFIDMLVSPGVSAYRVLKGLGRVGSYTFFEEAVERSSSVELSSRLLEPLGVELRDKEIVYAPGAEELGRVANDMASRGISGTPLIGLNPGAFRPSHRWPAAYWKEVANSILSKYPHAAIIVTGSPSEKELACSLKISDRVFVTAGLYSVREHAALYSMLDVFITNDTGPMHLAAATGAKTVCIFGQADHWRFAPSVPEARRRVLLSNLPGCPPTCFKYKCDSPRCLETIKPKDVLAAAEELLG